MSVALELAEKIVGEKIAVEKLGREKGFDFWFELRVLICAEELRRKYGVVGGWL